MDKIINGKLIRDYLLKEYKKEIVNDLKLVVIQVGNNSASDVYIKNKRVACEEVGISFELLKYNDISENDLIAKIEQLNNDSEVTGILVQLPLPNGMDEKRIINFISPLKDVDGLTQYNIGALYSNKQGLVPCTALGVLEILKYLDINLSGVNVTIVGRSNLVGIPLFKLLLNEDATVTMCHSKTKNLQSITKNADILISAVGKKHLITGEHIKDDAIVIDVGITKQDGKLYGDCDFDNIYNKCKYITPVPGGVGPLTVAMLIHNIIKASKLRK